jgi:fimbrial chaperone protein
MAYLRHAWRFGLLACLTAASGWVNASGLQVAPVGLSLKASQNADGLWLSNTGDDVIHAQVRVYHWTQNGADQLAPSSGLVISPPMLQIAKGDQQMIRVIRVGPPPNGVGAVEEAYRLSVDELPVDTKGKPGLHFVLHYSVPIFVEPVGATSPSPQLQWKLQRDGQHAVLQVSNNGNGHAQLATLAYIDSAGHRTEVEAGLLGYVLPGSTMHWVLKPPATVFDTAGTLEVMINGQKTTQNLSLASRSP